MNPEKFSINLLPYELMLQRQHGGKIALVNKITIGILVSTIFLTSVVLTIRILQSQSLEKSKTALGVVEAQVATLSEREVKLQLLKKYLSTINEISGSDSPRTTMFNLLLSLTPPGVDIRNTAIDGKGNTLLSAVSTSLSDIDSFVSNLSSKEKNADKISKIDLEGLSVGKDGVYRFSLRISVK